MQQALLVPIIPPRSTEVPKLRVLHFGKRNASLPVHTTDTYFLCGFSGPIIELSCTMASRSTGTGEAEGRPQPASQCPATKGNAIQFVEEVKARLYSANTPARGCELTVPLVHRRAQAQTGRSSLSNFSLPLWSSTVAGQVSGRRGSSPHS